MTRPFLALLATAIALVATPVAAQTAPDPTPSSDTGTGTIRLELIDQTFDLAANGEIRLTYRLIGDLAAVAELAPAPPEPPPTTAPATTTPPPDTTPSDTAPPDTVPSDATPPTTVPVLVDPATPATVDAIPSTTAPVEPVEPVVPPIALTARILNYEPITRSDDLDGLIGPDPRSARLPPVIDGIDLVDVRSNIVVESETEATLVLTVPTDIPPSVAERLEFDEAGVYPIVVELFAADQVVARHGTVVERRPTTGRVAPPIELAFLAVVDDPGPMADAADVQSAVSSVEGLIDDARRLDNSLTLSIPPSIASTAVGSGAVAAEPDLFADDELVATPATPFDVSSAVAVGRIDAFVNQLRAGEDEIADALSISAKRDVWPVTSALSAAAAQELRGLGVRYLAMTAAVFADTVAGDRDAELPAVDQFLALDLPDGSTLPMIIIDEELGAEFTTEATDDILAANTPAEWAIETIASLRIEQAGGATASPQRSHVISVPGLGAFDPRLIAALDQIAATTDAVDLVAASEISTSTDTQRFDGDARLPETAGPPLAQRLERLGLVQVRMDSIASMLGPDDPRRTDWGQRLDRLVSTSFDDGDVDAELDRLLAEAQTIQDGIEAPSPFTFTLAGREGDIDLRVGNRLDEPVTVVVRLASPRLSFPNGDTTITIPAEDSVVVNVSVTARSRGTSPVTVDILTPSGDPLVDTVTLTSRVNALAGLGQVLTGAFLLILGTWWFSHWRSRRRQGEPPDTSDVAAG